METHTLIHYSIKGVLVLGMIYYMIYPEKARPKNPKRVRLLLGLSILILVSTTLVSYAINKTAEVQTPAALNGDALSNDEVFKTLQNRLMTYSEEIRKDPLTIACGRSNQEDILSVQPKMSKELAETLGLVSCSCILESYKGSPFVQKARDLMSQGKTFAEAFHESIEILPDFDERTKHCSN